MIKNTWEMYEMINKYPRNKWHFYMHLQHSKHFLSWSEKKTKKYLKRLIEGGVIKEENGFYYPTPYKDLINWEEMNSRPEDWKDDLFEDLDKLCENKEHEWEELYDGIKQCKRCFKVEDIIKEEKRDD